MSQANIEVVLRLVDAINADEIPRELIAPDFELRNVTTAVTDAGASVELRWASVFWLRDGTVTRVVGYQRRRDALKAVGLQE